MGMSFQPQSHDYRWTRDHPLEQVHGNLTMPVLTRRQLATDPEMFMFALTVSIVEPKNIKEAMANSDGSKQCRKNFISSIGLKVWELVRPKPFGKMIIKLIGYEKIRRDEDQTKKLPLWNALYGLKARLHRPWYDGTFKLPDCTKGFTKVGFELTAFSDADHAGCLDTQKSTSGGIQFLGDKLVSWMSKKQNCTAMSSAEAEYVALSASCAQVMWMRTQLQDYGFNYKQYTLTEYQLADMFTKALPEDRFKYLVRRIGMRCLTPADLEDCPDYEDSRARGCPSSTRSSILRMLIYRNPIS
ncbi:hypothetical protein Tco_0862195 [Tanacetum coccineum]